MARRSMSILKERKLKLSTELAILREVNVEDFRTKEIQKKFLDKVFRMEVRLEEVDELLLEEEKKVKKVPEKKTIEGERQKNIVKVKEDLDRSDDSDDQYNSDKSEFLGDNKGA